MSTARITSIAGSSPPCCRARGVVAAAAPMASAGDGGGHAEPPAHGGGKPIPGQFIVTVERGKDPKGLAEQHGAKARFVYRAALNGFAAELTDRQVEALRHNPNVKSIEPNREITGDDAETYDLPVGARPDRPAFPGAVGLDDLQRHRRRRVRVRDRLRHPDQPPAVRQPRGGAVRRLRRQRTGLQRARHARRRHDRRATYGVAKAVQLALRVLNCTDSGDTAGSIAGIDWVRTNASKPAVANISIGAPCSDAVNLATTNLVNSGVFVAVAAGNDG